MRTQRLFAYAFAVCLVLLGTGSAIADDEPGNYNASLNGKYRIFSNLRTVGSTAHLWFTGVVTYDGNGHARMLVRGTVIDSTGSGDPGSFKEIGTFDYKVKRDGSFTQEGSFTSDPVGTYTVTGIKYVGQIGAHGSILILSGVIPPVPTTFTPLTSGEDPSTVFGSFTATAVRILQD